MVSATKQLRRILGLQARFHPEPRESIRSEIYSRERLEQHGENLARSQAVYQPFYETRRLAPRLKENGRILLRCYHAIARAIRRETAVTPAAEWLVDNFYIVAAQWRSVLEDFPFGYYRSLPKLASGPLAGFPRVYSLAWEFVSHTDSRWEAEALGRFIAAYQRVKPLAMGEIWAVPITLRVVLIENLRRQAERLVAMLSARDEADLLADQLLGLGGRPRLDPSRAVRRYQGEVLPAAFVVRLFQRLRDQDTTVRPALIWLEERLAARQTTADEMVRREHQEQVARNVTVRNVITSLRAIAAFDWTAFFEAASLVDAALAPATDFKALSFTTRDRYRHAIEDLARRSRASELEVARAAVEAVGQAGQRRRAEKRAPGRDEDPGYYLISRGRPAFERRIGYRVPLRSRLLRGMLAVGTPLYLGSLAALTACLLALALWACASAGASRAWLALFTLAAAFPASDLAIALINRGLTRILGPRQLPRLELEEGVPAEMSCVVAIPCLLGSQNEVEGLARRLEIHYLANPGGHLTFCLLGDWPDGSAERMPGDEEVFSVAARAVARLNMRYGPAPGGAERFAFFLRRRQWNPEEGKWMGWERKRGKLREFNRLLRGARDTSFIPTGSQVPLGARYVLTLDADTRLPENAARRLVGTIAHPLNRASFDPAKGRVTEGYGILQPRVLMILPPEGEGSLFQTFLAGSVGTDPYASAVSDLYQDLFAEGSYTGKGIYEVDVFEQALDGKVPANALLSHDLFEGTFARAGLVTDVEVFEEFPSRYEVAASRLERWTRGDWQLLPWILGRGPRGRKTRVPGISRWKMADNLRRSLSAPASLAAILLCLAGSAGPAEWGIGLVLASLFGSALLPVLTSGLVPKPGIAKRAHARSVAKDFTAALGRAAFSLCILAQQAWLMAQAISTALFRLLVSHKKLLEWIPAAQAASLVTGLNWESAYRRMKPSLGAGLLALLLAGLAGRGTWPAGCVLAAAWLAAPALVRWMSLTPPRRSRMDVLQPDERLTLRLAARRTWHFFSLFVGEEDHDLPPDNFQEDPKPVVAHRTSPTNIGLYLLSAVAAHDFGWLSRLDALERIERTLASLRGMQKYRGHLLNWYDTRSLAPLEPKYVSTVDSGNFAGYLLVLRQACLQWLDEPIYKPERLLAAKDAARLARRVCEGLAKSDWTQGITVGDAERALDEFSEAASAMPADPLAYGSALEALEGQAGVLVDMARTLAEGAQGRPSRGLADFSAWTRAIRLEVAGHRREFAALLPWARSLGRVPDWLRSLAGRVSSWSTTQPLSRMPESLAASLRQLASLGGRGGTQGRPAEQAALDNLRADLEKSMAACQDLLARLRAASQESLDLFQKMEFGFLYDRSKRLFSIGYRVNEGVLDSGSYDLLASEARLASFIAVAKSEVEPTHWFRLSRPLTPVGRGAALLSWSGSMFEYLMPDLVMASPSGSLIEETNQLVVERQIAYAHQRGVPWGISESAFHGRDTEMTYQYSNFGVPGLGLKRGLGSELVVAPYATALAAMVAPRPAVANLRRLEAMGAADQHGFYDAVDFTRERLPEGRPYMLVKNHMAHHQGIILLALDNVIHRGILRERFHANPVVQSAELLLQERTPRNVAVDRPVEEHFRTGRVTDLLPTAQRSFGSPHWSVPQTHLLSNGNLHVMLTSAGGGYTRWKGLALTRWREDATRDAWGSFLYLRNVRTGKAWSLGYQPCRVEPDFYQVNFLADKATFRRRDDEIVASLEVAVSAEDDVEERRLTLTNLGAQPQEIEVTSYCELVLAPPQDDDAHPAFSKLFVQTEFVPQAGALLANRRPRSEKDKPVWAALSCLARGEGGGGLQYETDRARFLGRGQEAGSPAALSGEHLLSNTTGTVLDPVFCLRRRVRVPAGGSVQLFFCLAAAPGREGVLELLDKHRDASSFERLLDLAWTQAQVEMRHLGIDQEQLHVFQSLANRVIYLDKSLRPSAEVLGRNKLGMPGLWSYGVSGDFPIVLLRVDESADRDIVRQVLLAHEFWRMKGLDADVVILNDEPASYAQDFQMTLENLVRMRQSTFRQADPGRHGSIFVLQTHQVPVEGRELLMAAARVVLSSRQGSLAEQVVRTQAQPVEPPPPPRALPEPPRPKPAPLPGLEFFNGLGGFSGDGEEYVVNLEEGQWTPAPWVNVIANPGFGTLVSESGSGYTWAENSRENKLTSWSNDPVADPPSEALYLRDEESGSLWSPTPLPVRRRQASYRIRHGQGYSCFETELDGIQSELWLFVAPSDPVKVSRLVVRNNGKRARSLSLAAYVEWVLGVERAGWSPYTATEIEYSTRALLATNTWSPEFSGRMAFLDLGGKQTAATGDRADFLGRHGTYAAPAALQPGRRLSGRTGAGLDPCGAMQTFFKLAPGGQAEFRVLLGQAAGREEALSLLGRYRWADLGALLEEARRPWAQAKQRLHVRTPDRALDIMMNHWLPYQALSCRIWARTAFYQAGGAFGFRDQLQDAMALVHLHPALLRDQIRLSAGKQFPQGDVLHWWHAPSGRGVRTRISDDRLWLPLAAAHYARWTGDAGIWDEPAGFVDGPALNPGQEDLYFQPGVSAERAALFEHCARAIDISLALGAHGLPLMGSGDWNDGMNRVGRQGQGESVWLAWFLIVVLKEFVPLARSRHDKQRADAWQAALEGLEKSVEGPGWDGDWYRRAYYDDGTPLGSASQAECRIDSIAQSWAVLAGGKERGRQERAMRAVEEYLYHPSAGLLLIFSPPFDATRLDPGYIKGYPPGLRENGGQYTQAALWAAIGWAALGEGDKAGQALAMLNPIRHGDSRAAIHRYKVEPYVMTADIYSEALRGRGGWSWYTGSAGWMLRAGLEWLLGFRLEGNRLFVDPCLPSGWNGFEIEFTLGSSRYTLAVENPERVQRGIRSLEVDGRALARGEKSALLAPDGGGHRIRAVMGQE